MTQILKVEQLADQRFRVRSGFGLLVRMLGLALVGLGAWIGVEPLFLNLFDWMLGHIPTSALVECLPGVFIGMVIGVPMLCVGWAMAFLRHSVEIDLYKKSLTEINDYFVWKARKNYPLDSVKSVLLISTCTRGKETTRHYVKAQITTNADVVTVVSEPARREQDVREIANQLAAILGVALEDKIADE